MPAPPLYLICRQEQLRTKRAAGVHTIYFFFHAELLLREKSWIYILPRAILVVRAGNAFDGFSVISFIIAMMIRRYYTFFTLPIFDRYPLHLARFFYIPARGLRPPA